MGGGRRSGRATGGDLMRAGAQLVRRDETASPFEPRPQPAHQIGQVQMRTTLDIDEDVLAAAKEIASARSTTAGKILSDLARQALAPSEEQPIVLNGVPLLPPRWGSRPVTMEEVNRLRDEEA